MKLLPKLSEKKKIVLLASIVLLALAIVVALYTQILRGGAQAAWWDSTWNYRKSIDITNGNTGDLTDFQVSFTLNTSSLIGEGKLQGDCDDLRITDSSGTLLPHWIEENNPGCNATNTKVWVKVPTVTQGIDATTIYVYYGKSDALNAEDGSSVFPFFDDFADGTLSSNWTATGAYSIANGEITITSGAVYSNTTVVPNAQNYIYEYRTKWNSSSGNYSGLHIANAQYVQSSNSGSQALVLYTSFPNSLSIGTYAADGTSSSYNLVENQIQYTASQGIYYIDGFLLDTTDLNIYHNRSLTNTYTGTWNYAPYLWLGYFEGSNSGTVGIQSMTTDWVLIRKHSENTPTISLNEEENLPPAAHWKFDEGSGSIANDSTDPKYDGSITGATWESAGDCVSGTCLGFDGTDDYVNIPNSFSSINRNLITVSMHVKTTSTTRAPMMGFTSVEYPSSPSSYVPILIMRADGTVQAEYWTGSIGYIISTTAINDGEWHHIAFVGNETTQLLYIDSQLEGSRGGTISNSWWTKTTVGASYEKTARGASTSGWHFFNGLIDDVKIYAHALTEEQIEMDFNTGNEPDFKAVFGGETGPTKTFSFESDTISIGNTIDNIAATQVTYTHDYIDPVVVAYIPTRQGDQSVDVRVKNVTSSGFEIFMEEPDNQTHASESVSYLVVESGRWEISEDLIIEARTHTTDSVHSGPDDYNGDPIGFSSSFPSTPVILATLNTYNNKNFMSTVVHNTSNEGFQLQQEGSETSIPALLEDIGWIAISTGSGTINGYAYESVIKELTGTPNGVTDTSTTIDFTNTFSVAPDVIVNGYTGNENDGYWARGHSYGASSIKVYAEEDQVGDSERSHAEEGFGYVALQSGANWASSAHTSKKVAVKNVFNVGEVTLNDTIDQTSATSITFPKDYINPVVVAFIKTRAGEDSLDVRVRNVTSSGFEIFMEEPDNSNHVPENISYLVVESGRWELSEGLIIEAGIHNTSNAHNSGENYNGDPITFSESFASTPAVLATLNSYNNNAFMSTVVHNTSSTGFQLQQEAGQAGRPVVAEDIGWIAVSAGSGTFNGYAYESVVKGLSGVDNGVTNTATTISFSTSFPVPPEVIVNGYTGNDIDGYWARGAGTYNASTLTLYAEEDQVGDTERSHGEEGFSYVAFQPGANWNVPNNNILGEQKATKYCVPGDTSTCSDPIAEWMFDENQGTTAYDNSVGSYDGSVNGAKWDIGRNSSGLSFDGIDDNVSITSNFGLGVTDVTIEAWVNLDSTSESGTIVRPGLGTGGYGMGVGSTTWTDDGNDLILIFENIRWIDTNTPIGTGWHHVAMTLDSSGYPSAYIDGKLVYSDTIGIANSTLGSETVIGGYGTVFLDAKIDEVRIFNYARTPAQVAWDYNRGKPIAYWKLDECSGTTANDSSGNLHNGTINIGASGTQSNPGFCTSENPMDAWYNGSIGKFNSSLNFDGVDDHIQIANSDDLDGGSDAVFTVSAWFKANDTSGYQGLVSKCQSTSTKDWSMVLFDSSLFYMSEVGGNNYALTYGPIEIDRWYHSVFVLDQPNNNLYLYLDGKLVASDESTPNISAKTSTPIRIGGDYNYGWPFNGQIDEVRIYNYTLTPQQIKLIYNNDAAVRF